MFKNLLKVCHKLKHVDLGSRVFVGGLQAILVPKMPNLSFLWVLSGNGGHRLEILESDQRL